MKYELSMTLWQSEPGHAKTFGPIGCGKTTGHRAKALAVRDLSDLPRGSCAVCAEDGTRANCQTKPHRTQSAEIVTMCLGFASSSSDVDDLRQELFVFGQKRHDMLTDI